jgi:tetratricopeptide (TPR) repeat protein
VFSGEHEAAVAHLERALTLAEQLELPATLAQALNSKSVLMLYRHRRRESRILVHGALRVALEHDLHDAALRAYNNVIAGEWYDQRYGEALTWLESALEYARRTGERQWEISFTAGSVGSLDMLGRWDEALQHAADAEPHASTEFVTGLMLWRVLTLCRRGEIASARAEVDRNAEMGASGNRDFASGYNSIRAFVLGAEGRDDEALETALAAVGSGGGVGDAWWIPFVALDAVLWAAAPDRVPELLEAVAALPGRPGRAVSAQIARLRARLPEHDAEAELLLAERLFRELETPFYVAAAQIERAEHLLATRPADAEELFRAAREELARLRAAPLLERVDAALGRERAVA